MSLNANVLLIAEEAKSSILEFLSKLVALIGAVGGVIALVMSQIEKAAVFVKQKRQQKLPNVDPLELKEAVAVVDLKNESK